MATIPRRPTGLRTVVPPQFVNRATTTLAQRQTAQPFRSATKPVAKVNPMQQTMVPQQGGVLVNGQPFNPPPGTNQGMLPNVQQSAPQPFNPNPNPGQPPMYPGFGGGKSASGQPANYYNGYQVGGDPWYDPNGQLSGAQPDSMPMTMPMDYGNQPNSYNGQLDLSGMFGQPQNAQTVPPQNMAQMGSSSYGGGKSGR
jgi:hypothetical protein